MRTEQLPENRPLMPRSDRVSATGRLGRTTRQFAVKKPKSSQNPCPESTKHAELDRRNVRRQLATGHPKIRTFRGCRSRPSTVDEAGRSTRSVGTRPRQSSRGCLRLSGDSLWSA